MPYEMDEDDWMDYERRIRDEDEERALTLALALVAAG